MASRARDRLRLVPLRQVDGASLSLKAEVPRRLIIRHVLQEVAWLACKRFAHCFKRGEANGADLSRLDARQVYWRDADALGKLLAADLSLCNI